MSPLFFTGTYTQRVDGKRRVSVPSSFRDVLGKSEPFYVFPSPSHPGVAECFSQSGMAELHDRIDELDPFSDEQAELSVALFGGAHALKPDGEGRVVLPDDIRKHAKIAGECVFVGTGKTFRLYSPENWEHHREQARFKANEHRKALRKRREVAPAPSAPASGA